MHENTLVVKAGVKGSKIHGTFGELLQGYVYNDITCRYEHFLFSAPVHERWSYAFTTDDSVKHLEGRELCRRMERALEERCGVNLNERGFEIKSNITKGKGMSSSTADIYSIGRLAQMLNPDCISDEDLRECARRVEYGDEVLSARISLCEQRNHKLIEAFSSDMGLVIIGIDTGLHIKTSDIHAKIHENKTDAAIYENLRNRLSSALRVSDYRTVGEIATKSGYMFLKYNNYPLWQMIKDVNDTHGGLGVVLAHSGSVIGVLISKRQEGYERIKQNTLADLHEMQPELYTLMEGK